MLELLREWCLAFPGAIETYPFDAETMVFKVQAEGSSHAKMFALLSEHKGGSRINLKCEPALAVQLRTGYVEVVPGYHMNKTHWNSVVLSEGWAENQSNLKQHHVLNMIEDSYDLVVSALPKRDRLLLDWKPV